MSSNSIPLDDLLEALQTRLAEALPEWRVRNMAQGVLTTAGTTLYFEQGDISSETQGQTMPPGFVVTDINLALASKYKDPTRAANELNAAIIRLLPVLDSMPDIHWTAAQRGVLDDTGTPCYLIPAQILATYTLPETTPEPTPEPEETPEAPAPEEG